MQTQLAWRCVTFVNYVRVVAEYTSNRVIPGWTLGIQRSQSVWVASERCQSWKPLPGYRESFVHHFVLRPSFVVNSPMATSQITWKQIELRNNTYEFIYTIDIAPIYPQECLGIDHYQAPLEAEWRQLYIVQGTLKVLQNSEFTFLFLKSDYRHKMCYIKATIK